MFSWIAVGPGGPGTEIGKHVFSLLHLAKPQNDVKKPNAFPYVLSRQSTTLFSRITVSSIQNGTLLKSVALTAMNSTYRVPQLTLVQLAYTPFNLKSKLVTWVGGLSKFCIRIPIRFFFNACGAKRHYYCVPKLRQTLFRQHLTIGSAKMDPGKWPLRRQALGRGGQPGGCRVRRNRWRLPYL